MDEISNIEKINYLNEQAWTMRITDIKKCLDISSQVLSASNDIKYDKGIADAKRNLGYCYWRMSDYEKSLDYTLQSIELYRKINDKKGMADALNNLGAVYMFQKEHQKRLDVNKECLSIREDINDYEGVSSSMNNIGETYMEMGDYENAKIWFERCIQYPNASISSLAWANFNMGKLYFNISQKEFCLNYFTKARELASSLNYHSLLTEIFYYLSKYYFSEGHTESAVDYIHQSFRSAEIIDNKEGMAMAARLLSEIYEQKNQYKEALDNFKKYNNLREQIINESNIKTIQQLEMQYETDKLKREAEIQKLNNEALINSYQKIEFEHKELSDIFNTFRENIGYAQHIQKNLLHIPEKFIQQYPYHFLIYKPMMMISGDFIWTHVSDDSRYYYVAVGDATGHGVSAALISMLCLSHLNNAVKNYANLSEITRYLYEQIQILNQTSETNSLSDKNLFEIVLIRIDATDNVLDFYSSGIEVLLFKDNNITILNSKHNELKIPIKKNNILYVYTDGIYDQLGGEKGKRLKRKNWRNYLFSLIQQQPMYSHKACIEKFFETWKNKEAQTDDITVFGLQF